MHGALLTRSHTEHYYGVQQLNPSYSEPIRCVVSHISRFTLSWEAIFRKSIIRSKINIIRRMTTAV